MSVVLGAKAAARRRARWLPTLLALLVAAVGVWGASCSADPHSKSSANGSGGPPNNKNPSGCIGPTCPEACAAHPVPGCGCSVEGQHLLCGEVQATYPGEGTSAGATVCGSGFSVCSKGLWGACQITGAVTLVPNAPPGYYTMGFGSGTNCMANPCDPACIDFHDTPNGLTGTGLNFDGGVSLANDGGAVCQPSSCAGLGFNCGMQSDGCGNVIDCGTCSFPATCGGSGKPSVCGVSATCTGLCLNQVSCTGTTTTSISGTVYMPNGTVPLPNVLVYVPNATLSPFSSQVACVMAGSCTSEVSGSPLVATTTAVDGTFTLKNVPANVSFNVVIQLGRFRRQFTMPAVPPCTNAPVACANAQTCLTRFPQIENETSPYDNIPKMAFATGCVDALECVWRKVGIASSGPPGLGGMSYGTGEFTPGNTNGRINFYAGSGCPGTYITDIGTTTPYDTILLGDPALLSNYDMLLFPCQGGEYYYGGNQIPFETNIANFANAGGRVFSTHYSYIWLITQGNYSSPLSSAINWDLNQAYSGPDPTTGYINTGFLGGQTLASWLMVPGVGASTVYGEMQINTIRHDFDSVNPPTQLYVSIGPQACVSTNSDPNNCGGCGQICAGGQVCSAGTCTNACSAGYTNCSGACTGVLTDPNNCGACGQKCGTGQSCNSGTCTCPAGTSACGGGCAVLSSDPGNCGACGNACPAGATCNAGTCQCAAGLTKCGNACVDTTADPNNCGTCGTVCNTATVYRCHAGACTASLCSSFGETACVLANNQRYCESTTTFQTDPVNCGSCFNTCKPGQVCTNGACTGACGNTSSDPNNCGACGNVCGTGETCVGGVCTCAGGSACGTGIPMQASFNTPLGTPTANQCGRVVFSDFHVETSNNTKVPFPTECGGGGFSPQEFLLAQALFDLAGCVSINAPQTCKPVTCGFLGLNCGTAGDGCGGTLNCGTCTAPATCGGDGTPGVCGSPPTYTAADFVRDYDASSLCTGGQHPVWRLYSWSAVTPKDSHIDFSIATATSMMGLGTAMTYALGWSNPPGVPAGLAAGQPASAHAVGQPAGTPDTELGSASPDATLLADKLSQNNYYLRVIAHLAPSSDLLSTPVLSSWDMQIDCVDNQ
jgi:hypothetical protein